MSKEMFERINYLCTDYADDIKRIPDAIIRQNYLSFMTTINKQNSEAMRSYTRYFNNDRNRGFSPFEAYFLTHKSLGVKIKHSPVYFASRNWVKNRIYFEFEEKLEKQIQDSCIADSEDVPAELLNRLPYSCFFVATRGGGFVDWEIENRFKEIRNKTEKIKGNGVGFFAIVTPQQKYAHEIGALVNTGDKILDIIACADTINDRDISVVTTSMVIPKNGDMTINEAMIPYAPYDNMPWSEEEKRLSYQYDMTVLLSALQYILYLCAENNVIQPRVIAKPKSWASKKKKLTAQVKVLDVLEPKETPAVRVFPPKNVVSVNNESTVERYETGQTKSPHTRRGHWHTYWTGPRSNRVRKLVWVNEARIHPELETSGAILKTKDDNA